MKNLIFSLLLGYTAALYPQSFQSLDGFESQTGETFLLYRLGSDYFHYNPVYKLNTSDLSEELIIDAYNNYFPGGQLAKAVWDFEYFPDKTNFMNVGYQINPDNHSYIARNDSIVFGGIDGYYRVDISKQDPMKVFAFGGGPITRSFDGGFTFPLDSMGLITNFDAISLADFDDNVLFGVDIEGQFAKNAAIVDTAKVFFDQYTKVLYDVNQFHIYRANKTYGGYTLNVSNNKGNAFTWTKTYQSENPIFITIDSSNSGLVYLADGRNIYKSVNNGYTFNIYKSLPHKLVGIYKKPNSDVLYAASKSKIFKLTPDSTIIIKILPFTNELLNYYPLAVGNFWLYNVIEWSDPFYYSQSTFSRRVISKDTLSNNKEYFKIEEKYYESNYIKYVFERIDKENGLAYRFDNECTNPDSEKVIENFTAEIGDSLLIQRYTFCWDSILTVFSQEEIENVLGENRNIRTFEYNWLMSYVYKMAKGIGIYSVHQGYCFGYTNSFLKGCVIGGVVYGDTLVTSVDDDKEAIPIEFSLAQNYPNPFNPSTIIQYAISSRQFVTLKVYDVLGNEIATLVNEEKPAGEYEVEFDGSNLSSGIYFYRLTSGSNIKTKKMVLIR